MNNSFNKSNKKSWNFKVWLDDKEMEMLEKKSDEAGMTKTEFLRNMCMYGRAFPTTVFSKGKLLRYQDEINHISNNLKQISYRAQGNLKVDERDFVTLYNMYMDLINDFDKYTKGE